MTPRQSTDDARKKRPRGFWCEFGKNGACLDLLHGDTDVSPGPEYTWVQEVHQEHKELLAIVKQAIDKSIPYIASYGAFMIPASIWNELAAAAYPEIKRFDEISSRISKGEKMTEAEIDRILEGESQ